MTTPFNSPTDARLRRFARHVWLALTLWAAAVILAAETGLLARVYTPTIAAVVAATIVVPTLIYAMSGQMQTFMSWVGHRRILQFHIWRIPAALVFFWYGFNGDLPPLFWTLAGVGDLLAGSYAAYLTLRPASARDYRRFHAFGFADFVVAVGTGLTFTLLLDPRMNAIAALPLALIPLFGVGISGATHLMAFDMLRREARTASPALA